MNDIEIRLRIVKYLDAKASPSMETGFAFVDLAPVAKLLSLDEGEFRSKHVGFLESKGIIEVNPPDTLRARLSDIGYELFLDEEIESHLGPQIEAEAQHPVPQSKASIPGERAKAFGVFIALSTKDEEHLEQLENHLSLLRRQGKILPWNFRRIGAGDDWRGEIDNHLDSADIILLLISADFIASEYCWDVEMKRALERHRSGEARIIPIIVRDCDWHNAPFGKFQALPRHGKPVTAWQSWDQAYADIARGIRKVVDELSGP